MKNKLVVFMFIGIVVLTGCGKKDTFKKIQVDGARVVCKSITDESGIKIENVTTIKFNSDKYVNYQLLESTLIFEDKDNFKSYVEAYNDSKDSIELGEGVEYEYSFNKKDMKIYTYMIYNESVFNYDQVSEEDKANYLASAIIKRYEDSGATCQFIETTKEALGLE